MEKYREAAMHRLVILTAPSNTNKSLLTNYLVKRNQEFN